MRFETNTVNHARSLFFYLALRLPFTFLFFVLPVNKFSYFYRQIRFVIPVMSVK